MTVAAVVPARNEAARITATVAALRPLVDEVIVVDDASEDDTGERARAAGASVVRTSERAGKGGALRLGLAQTRADIVCLIDGDLGATASVASVLLEPIRAGEADMTIAAPPPSGPSGFGLVERFARWGVRRLSGFDARRPLSGQRALRREVLARAVIAPRFGVEVALTIDAVRSGFRVIEVIAPIEHAKTGRSLAGFTHRAKQGLDIAVALGRRSMRRH